MRKVGAPAAEGGPKISVVRCGVVVEVAGRRLPVVAREVGLQIVDQARGPSFVKVLGFNREFRFLPRDVRQVVSTRAAEGQLVIVGVDGAKVHVSRANPSDLERVLLCLQGTAGQTAGAAEATAASAKRKPDDVGESDSAPSKKAGIAAGDDRARPHATPSRAGLPGNGSGSSIGSTPSLAQPAGEEPRRRFEAEARKWKAERAEFEAQVKKLKDENRELKRRLEEATGQPFVETPPLSFIDLPEPVLDQTLALALASGPCCRQISQSCTLLAAFIMERRPPAFHLGASRNAGISPEYVVQHVARRSVLQTLDLSGWAELTAGESKQIAEELGKKNSAPGGGLRNLSLRGCKLLTDAAVKRLLSSCPGLVSLDLLEIPRLTDQALRTPLPGLQILAAGSLVHDSARQRAKELSSMAAGQSVSMVGQAAPLAQRFSGSSKFTVALLTGLETTVLTHLVLARCGELEAFPQLPANLQHLDLSFTNIEAPRSFDWRPLAGCLMLRRLILTGNRLLSRNELQVALASIPQEAQLEVLDLSSTLADATLFKALVQMLPAKRLTHLRVAECGGLRNASLHELLHHLTCLEILDVAGCRGLESPLVDLSLSRVAERAESVSRGAGPQPSVSLRLFGVGQTDLAGPKIENTRREMRLLAPHTEVVAGSLDIFGAYTTLPPQLLLGGVGRRDEAPSLTS